MTRTLASELKPHHIAVNETIPGPVLKEHMLTPEKLRETEDRKAIELPNGEWHKVPADLGELALFLARSPVRLDRATVCCGADRRRWRCPGW